VKILWLTPFLPDPDATHAGGRAIYQWLSRLAQRHEITLLCRVDTGEAGRVDALRRLCHDVHVLRFDRPTGPLTTVWIAASYFRLGRTANHLLRRGGFDLLHVEYVESGVGIATDLDVPAVLIAIDELAKPARRRFELAHGLAPRLATYLYWATIRGLERRICRKFNRILAASEYDRHLFRALDPRLPVATLPFPVGIDAGRMPATTREADHLLFVGAMHRDTNIDAVRHFCIEVLPAIRRTRPDVRLTIVGHEPPPEIRRLSRDPGIVVTGFVPRLEPYYARATVFVCPVRIGGGILLKNVDAMAAGCPVVTTSAGNEGVGATPGVHLLTADDPGAFAEATVRLLGDADERRRLADNAREFVRARFSVEAAVSQLEETYREVGAA